MYFVTLAVIFILEMILKGATQGLFSSSYFWLEILIIFLISCGIASLLFLLRNNLAHKKGKIVYASLMVLIGFCYGAQIVYNSVFGTYFTIYSALNGVGQAFEFIDVVLANIWDEKLYILMVILVAVPVIRMVYKAKTPSEKSPEKYSKKLVAIVCILVMIASIGASFLLVSIKNHDPKSPYQKIYVVGEMKTSVECCGLIGGLVIDSWRALFGFDPKLETEENYVETKHEDNVIKELDFEGLALEETDETLKAMHQYFGAQTPTEENEKTGIFEGKNLIFITAEAFSDIAVDPVHTPTLYKLQTEGYQFTNWYNPVWGTSTIDGEYVNLQGLVPKPGVWSMKESRDNYLPFTLGNQFTSLGYKTFAYHNHSVYFYERDKSHPNLGYTFKGQGRDYNFTNTWPESDIEMIDQTTVDFLTPNEKGEVEPFHIYYLTVSGHLAYNFYGNNIAEKNQDLVEDMTLSTACKAYVATQIELDRAVELLIERLDEAGVLEDTVIAIAGDHYPYGLTAEEISEFKGYAIDEEYELYKGTFILWTPGIEGETVEKVCSNMDILPTLSNMFALEYDSRLLMGKDIFADEEGFAVFKDKNWVSDKGTRSELEETDPEYVKEMDKKASNIFNYSALILDKDYYSLIFEKETE